MEGLSDLPKVTQLGSSEGWNSRSGNQTVHAIMLMPIYVWNSCTDMPKNVYLECIFICVLLFQKLYLNPHTDLIYIIGSSYLRTLEIKKRPLKMNALIKWENGWLGLYLEKSKSNYEHFLLISYLGKFRLYLQLCETVSMGTEFSYVGKNVTLNISLSLSLINCKTHPVFRDVKAWALCAS